MVRKDVSLVRVMIRCPLTGRAIPAGLTAGAGGVERPPHRSQQGPLSGVHANPYLEQDRRIAGTAERSLDP